MLKEHQHLTLWDGLQRHLGDVIVEEEVDSWRFGQFSPTPDFSSVESLFRESIECANQQLFTHLDDLDQSIAQLNLKLKTDEGNDVPYSGTIQIGEGRLSFRLDQPQAET